MRLRELRETDATNMLEWMQDDDVVRDLHGNFRDKTYEDAIAFIRNANNCADKHWAIASDIDEYMGTVSLKNIDFSRGTAEFAIAIRSCAMGSGYSWFGMKEAIDYAFNELNLECVYWCVSRNNKRAVRFYDKHNFHETIDVPEEIQMAYNDNSLKWYSVLAGDTIGDIRNVLGCKVIRIKTIPTLDSGELSVFEAQEDLPFTIERFYYISKVPEGKRRGFHAHRELKQLLFCPFGRVLLTLDDGRSREEIELSDPSIGLLIDKPIWREMLWIESNSVLCVAASQKYNPEDYIRDYSTFLKYIDMDQK